VTDIRETTVTTLDGRTLRVVEAGSLDGFPVLWHHGTPSSSLLYEPWIEVALEKDVRLIGYDRPGYAGSTPQPKRSVGDAAGDVEAIARSLGIESLTTGGVSGGGPHVLACAALLPHLVGAAACIAGLAPPDAEGLDLMAGMGETNVVEFGAALDGRAKLEPLLEEFAASMLSGTAEDENLESLISEADAAVMPELTEWLDGGAREGLAPGLEGWIDDDIAFVTPWGFDLADIKVPVLLWQGEQDLMVPFEHGRWLAARIPGVDARLTPEDGHLTITTNHFDDILDWLLAKSG
jgi:pimeloyl-ACP methyl ester carboxylesterase